MKMLPKAVLIGFVSFFVFLIGNVMLARIVGIVIPGGDDFINSYFHPLYAGITLLGSLIISCTYLIVKKIELLLDKIKEKEVSV